MKNRLITLCNEYKSLALFIVLMVAFRSAIADYSAVPTGSMQPTIVEGDVIFINKMAYDLRIPLTKKSLFNISNPQRGDIIIFDSKASDLRLVKRVVGIPGDRLELRHNQLIINGIPLDYHNHDINQDLILDLTENLLGVVHMIRLMPHRISHDSFGLIQVPEGYYFAMGDSRDNSADSRVIGLVPRSEIIGRTKRTLVSVDLENYLKPRFERFLHQL